jgi:ABC-type polar amino acid transport system ATPase subunit
LETSDDVFWISGKAGSGKSTFMKFLFEHQQTQVHLERWAGGDVIAAAFFFWRAGSSELEKSYVGLLQGLLYQVLQDAPS